MKSKLPFSVMITGGFPYFSLMYTANFLNPHGTMRNQLEAACKYYWILS